MLLIIVRRDAGEHYRYLQHVFAGLPVFIAWGRRTRERREHRLRLPGDRRRRERRASSLSLARLPFIAVRQLRPAG